MLRLVAEARRSESPCGAGSMVWWSWGGGPALVLLHGGAGSWQHWVRTVPAFSRTHRVLAPDLPGLGESADPPAPRSVRERTRSPCRRATCPPTEAPKEKPTRS